jgi:hypothetical protein
MMLIQKQHEDIHIEFKEGIENIGKRIANNPLLMEVAIKNGLDVNWLLDFEIPEKLTDIYKSIREKGLLR